MKNLLPQPVSPAEQSRADAYAESLLRKQNPEKRSILFQKIWVIIALADAVLLCYILSSFRQF